MNKAAATIGTVLMRIAATFVYQAMAVIGGASIIGGIPVYKAALLSGVTATATVIQKLAAAYADDGKITLEELDAAFAMNSAPSSKEVL
jgi:hypothetical protein|tara:strand:- start:2089 stop:2355 length:267 start_codon:yes stop_codon:yes gene_type:complete